jgi:hypothetical protein
MAIFFAVEAGAMIEAWIWVFIIMINLPDRELSPLISGKVNANSN